MRRFSIIACCCALGLMPLAAPAQDSAPDDVQARYDALMNAYDALSQSADTAFAEARDFESRDDTANMCLDDRAGLNAFAEGMDKLDQMIAIIRGDGADATDMEAVKAGNQAIIDEVMATVAARCDPN